MTLQKAIFFDIDGTLVNAAGEVPVSALQSIDKARKRGHRIFIATGRSKAGLVGELGNIKFDGMVLGSGAYIECENKTLYRKTISNGQLTDIVNCLFSEGADIIFETEDKVYLPMNHEINLWGDNVEYYYARDWESITNIHKFIYRNSKSDMDSLQKRFSDQFLILPNSFGEVQGEFSGEVTEIGVTKKTGIRRIQEHLDINRKDIIAFGDNWNDIEMIKYAGIGIAMGNGVEELKAVADIVTPSVEDDGVAIQLNKLGLTSI